MPITRKHCAPIQVAQVRQKLFCSGKVLTQVFLIEVPNVYFVCVFRSCPKINSAKKKNTHPRYQRVESLLTCSIPSLLGKEI